MKKRLFLRALTVLVLALVVWGCTIRISFSGASISPDVKTVRVDYFNNMASYVAPILSSTFTDDLTTKIQRETSLTFTKDTPDVLFEGVIIDYNSAPVAISGDEYAQENRLTIAIRVSFTNRVEPQYSFENKTFTAYSNYSSSEVLTSVESTLIPEIVEQLVEDVFNAAFSNW